MKEFTKQSFDILRKDIAEAFAKVEKKHGINLSIGNIKFDENAFHTTVKGQISHPELLPANAEDRDIEYLLNFKKLPKFQQETLYGINESMCGVTRMYKGQSHVFVGIAPRKRKYPMVFRRADGACILMTIDTAKRLLTKETE